VWKKEEYLGLVGVGYYPEDGCRALTFPFNAKDLNYE
jgi:hypothetical protein